MSLVIRPKGESQNGCFKKTKIVGCKKWSLVVIVGPIVMVAKPNNWLDLKKGSIAPTTTAVTSDRWLEK